MRHNCRIATLDLACQEQNISKLLLICVCQEQRGRMIAVTVTIWRGCEPPQATLPLGQPIRELQALLSPPLREGAPVRVVDMPLITDMNTMRSERDGEWPEKGREVAEERTRGIESPTEPWKGWVRYCYCCYSNYYYCYFSSEVHLNISKISLNLVELLHRNPVPLSLECGIIAAFSLHPVL